MSGAVEPSLDDIFLGGISYCNVFTIGAPLISNGMEPVAGIGTVASRVAEVIVFIHVVAVVLRCHLQGVVPHNIIHRRVIIVAAIASGAPDIINQGQQFFLIRFSRGFGLNSIDHNTTAEL
jgi:hypothetical protein